MTPEDNAINKAYRDIQSAGSNAAADATRHLWGSNAAAVVAAMNQMNGVNLDSARFQAFKDLQPTFAMFEQYKTDVLFPGLAEVSAKMFEIQGLTNQFATSPAWQDVVERIHELTGINDAIQPGITSAVQSLLQASRGTNRVAETIFDGPAFAEVVRTMTQLNTGLNSFSKVYDGLLTPISDDISRAIQDAGILGNLDLSVLEEIDEEVFDDFIEQHPELDAVVEQVIQDVRIVKSAPIDAVRVRQVVAVTVYVSLVATVFVACNASPENWRTTIMNIAIATGLSTKDVFKILWKATGDK